MIKNKVLNIVIIFTLITLVVSGCSSQSKNIALERENIFHAKMERVFEIIKWED